MELLLILLIALILWPKPIIGALKWAIRYAFRRPSIPEAEPEADAAQAAEPDEPVSPEEP